MKKIFLSVVPPLYLFVFVVCGSGLMAQFPALIPLDSLDGSDGFTIRGVDQDDGTGWAVAGLGDINGDGLGDMLLGANLTKVGGDWGAGTTFLVYGSLSYPALLNLDNISLNQGMAIEGIRMHDSCGFSLSRLGDYDGDGREDMLIGGASHGNFPFTGGMAYVVYGQDSSFATPLKLDNLDPQTGFGIRASGFLSADGRAVSAAGDLNGDGLQDVLLGSEWYSEAWVIFGDSTRTRTSFYTDSMTSNEGLKIIGAGLGDKMGRAVSRAGDVNGDGVDDLLLGAPMSAKVYLIYGKQGGWSQDLDLTNLRPSEGMLIQGQSSNHYTGYSVSGGGDINGDGFMDMLIGSPYFRFPAAQYANGAAFVVYGGQNLPATLNLTSLDGQNGYRIVGIDQSGRLGWAVSCEGDINADGLADVLVGVPHADPKGVVDAGRSYLVFGRRGGTGADVDLSLLNGQNGFRLDGFSEQARSGWSVSSSGDIFGDGTADLMIGSPFRYIDGQYSVGEVYVMFGISTKTGLFDVYFELDFRLYPNPAKAQVFIQSEELARGIEPSINLYDMMGKAVPVLLMKESPDQLRLDISHVSPGVYMLRMVEGGKMGTRKLLVVR